MPKATGTEQYVLLPVRGLRARGPSAGGGAREFLRALDERPGEVHDLPAVGGVSVPVRVVDSIPRDGAKLVEIPAGSALAMRALQPGLRLVPLRYYTPAVAPRPRVETAVVSGRTADADTITLQVVSKRDRAPVAGAFVVAFTDLASAAGAEAVTDADGQARLALGASQVTLERLYVYPTTAQWSLVKRRAVVSDGMRVSLEPIDLGYTDGVRHFYGNPPESAGEGVTVGVIDSGIAHDHPDLVVAGGANTVMHENPKDWRDNGSGHGTHVAGIVAARGTPPDGVRGVAPGVVLRSYRVFGRGSRSASSFSIAKAIDRAVADGCDLLNMSLGGGPVDDVLKAAIEDARAAGSVCIVASGNDGRAPVGFPASDGMAVAVSALGRRGTFPRNAAAADDVAPPYGTDRADFVAAFSNVGPEIDLTGPGVAIISTLPGGHGEISGTSMACPAVTGVAARVVAAPGMVPAKRDGDRSAAIVKALLATAVSRGLPPPLEGLGLPEPD